jgi:uncharacterized membrane protein YgcG
MTWLVGAAVVLVGAALFHYSRRRRDFDYKGRRYSRHGDGGFTYADGVAIPDAREHAEVKAYWDDSHSSSNSSGDDGDGGGDGGGGD